MSLFKVSVIIPVYNCEQFIKDSVGSALSLDEVGEVILVDDGSTDDSFNVCNKLKKNNSKVKVFRHADNKNHGPSASRNLGILKATCDFVSFLDADDIYLSNRFEEEIKIFQTKADIEGVYGCSHTIFITDWGKQQYYKVDKSHIYTVTQDIPPDKLFINLLFYWSGRIHTSAITIKKSAFKLTGLFNEKLRWAEDTELWLRLAFKIKMLPGNLKEPIAIRRVHNENIIHQVDKAKLYNDRMYHSLFNWALAQNPSFEVLNNIINAQKLYSYCYKEISYKRYIWLIFVKHPKIILTSFFWKKLLLVYFKN